MLYQTVAAALSNLSGGRIDFFNIGGLAIQRTRDGISGLWTHYSWREYFIRGGILVTTAFTAYLGASSCDDDDCSPVLNGILGAGLGFFASHSLAILPTLQHRSHIINAINSMDYTLTLTMGNLKAIPDPSLPMKLFISKASEMQKKIMLFDFTLRQKGDVVKALVIKKQEIKKLTDYIESSLSTLLNAENMDQTLEKINENWDSIQAAISSALYGDQPQVTDNSLSMNN